MEKPCLWEVHKKKEEEDYFPSWLLPIIISCLAHNLNPVQFWSAQVIMAAQYASSYALQCMAFHPSLELKAKPRNSSMHLLSLAAWQQPVGKEVGEAAFLS